MEVKKITLEEKQRNFYNSIVKLAKKGKDIEQNGSKYKEVTLWIPIEIIPEIERWAEELKVE